MVDKANAVDQLDALKSDGFLEFLLDPLNRFRLFAAEAADGSSSGIQVAHCVGQTGDGERQLMALSRHSCPSSFMPAIGERTSPPAPKRGSSARSDQWFWQPTPSQGRPQDHQAGPTHAVALRSILSETGYAQPPKVGDTGRSQLAMMAV